MCWSCQKNSSTEEVIRLLNESLSNTKTDPEYFSKWNTTSFAFLLYPSVGIYGPEAKQKALELFELFKTWVQNQPVHYVPTSGTEPM